MSGICTAIPGISTLLSIGKAKDRLTCLNYSSIAIQSGKQQGFTFHGKHIESTYRHVSLLCNFLVAARVYKAINCVPLTCLAGCHIANAVALHSMQANICFFT